MNYKITPEGIEVVSWGEMENKPEKNVFKYTWTDILFDMRNRRDEWINWHGYKIDEDNSKIVERDPESGNIINEMSLEELAKRFMYDF